MLGLVPLDSNIAFGHPHCQASECPVVNLGFGTCGTQFKHDDFPTLIVRAAYLSVAARKCVSMLLPNCYVFAVASYPLPKVKWPSFSRASRSRVQFRIDWCRPPTGESPAEALLAA